MAAKSQQIYAYAAKYCARVMTRVIINSLQVNFIRVMYNRIKNVI